MNPDHRNLFVAVLAINGNGIALTGGRGHLGIGRASPCPACLRLCTAQPASQSRRASLESMLSASRGDPAPHGAADRSYGVGSLHLHRSFAAPPLHTFDGRRIQPCVLRHCFFGGAAISQPAQQFRTQLVGVRHALVGNGRRASSVGVGRQRVAPAPPAPRIGSPIPNQHIAPFARYTRRSGRSSCCYGRRCLGVEILLSCCRHLR